MTYEVIKGDLFQNTEVEAIVNTVNLVGISGKGIALQFKNKYPENHLEYKKICENNELKIGQMHVFDLGEDQKPRYIINFPTKKHWKENSHIDYIKSGLISLLKTVRSLKIKSIAIPALGCTNGQLSWKIVKPYIQATFSKDSDIKAFIYEPRN